jgi:hypothetical protein
MHSLRFDGRITATDIEACDATGVDHKAGGHEATLTADLQQHA